MKSDSDSDSNKTSHIVCLVIGIIAFASTIFVQNALSANGIADMNSVIAQIQVIISTLLVILSRRKGFIGGIILNFMVFIMASLQFFVKNNSMALPGMIVPICTIITISIIYVFSSKIRKMHDELTESYNQIVETNRIMKEKDEKLTYLAYYDIITNMPNRHLFISKLDENIENNILFTVIYADIDDFKKINDVYGHNSGDVVLCELSDRIHKFCGERDFTGRLGGDEFAIVLKGAHSDVEVNGYINKLRSVIAEPFPINGNLIHITMSYGVASYPNDGKNTEDIFKCTDIAVFNAKAEGKDRPCFYNRIK